MGSALVNHPSLVAGATTSRPDEAEGAAKGIHENPGPKGVWKPGGMAPNRSPIVQDRVDRDKERLRGEVVANAILVDRVALLSVEDKDNEGPAGAANGAAPVALAT